ncbi:hypothetical protein [Sulfurimonas sp.]|uniref:hypothetical protein n=1 Tax=Sulfurimonas sp. TaxID=2022749 RepID=UPI0025E5BDA4|nr:hypothetical protein [Sulfurimonas sp.]MDD5156705.1 hypothetical protein [Sulfurimonas sp.]
MSDEIEQLEANDKADLLEEIDEAINPKMMLDKKFLAYVLFSILFVLVVLFPKIYIQQQIYFISRDVAKLKGEYDGLKEENRLISSSVESIRFKNQIIDPLF